MTDKYWIPTTLMGEYTADRISHALIAACQVHNWTIEKLKERFLETLLIPTLLEIKLNARKYIYINELGKNTQRYTLESAVQKAHSEFREVSKVIVGDQVIFPTTIAQEKYTDLTIQSRKIWSRYLQLYNGISTTYGMLVLDRSWTSTFQAQAYDNGIHIKRFPSLWRDITLKCENDSYKVMFNLHSSEPIRTRGIKYE